MYVIFNRGNKTSTVIEAVGFVLLLYDHMLTFRDEVDSVWSARPSFAKKLFLLNRYTVPAMQLTCAICRHFIHFLSPMCCNDNSFLFLFLSNRHESLLRWLILRYCNPCFTLSPNHPHWRFSLLVELQTPNHYQPRYWGLFRCLWQYSGHSAGYSALGSQSGEYLSMFGPPST